MTHFKEVLQKIIDEKYGVKEFSYRISEGVDGRTFSLSCSGIRPQIDHELSNADELKEALQIRRTHEDCPECDFRLQDSTDHKETCRFYRIENSI